MNIKKLPDGTFAADFKPTEEDAELGDELAETIGDTFIDACQIGPSSQWEIIAMILRVHGLQIVPIETNTTEVNT